MGSNKNKRTSSQPGRVGRPRKAKNKGKPAVDPPVPSPKSRPKPRPKRRSVPLEPDGLSAESESDAIIAATEGLLGLSKARKTHDGGASGVEDSNGGSTPSDMDVDGGGVAIDLDEDDETSKSSNSDGEEEDEGKLFVSSVMMMD
jgi:hypothetical protein